MPERAISVAADEVLREIGIVAQKGYPNTTGICIWEAGNVPSTDSCGEEGLEESREQREKKLPEKLLLTRKTVVGRDSGRVTKEKRQELWK